MHLSLSGPQADNYQAIIPLLGSERIPAGWETMASSDYARVFRNPEGSVFYKEFLSRSALESIKSALRGSRATRARINNERLSRLGISAPENLCWGTLANGHEFLLSTAAPGTGVTHLLRNVLNKRDATSLKRRRTLLRQLGSFIGKLHHQGWVHGDLRTSNVLAQEQSGDFTFSLIDNERNSHHRRIPRRLLKKNLMQLNMLLPQDITLSDRWRFFEHWHNEFFTMDAMDARKLAIEAYQLSVQRLRAKGKL